MLPSVCMNNIGDAVDAVRARIQAAAERAGRASDEIELMAVSKNVGPPLIQAAIDAGVRVLGENRVQEARAKIAAVRGSVSWHLIGKLQSNKARLAARLFDAVHSVDRESLVPKLAAAASDAGRELDVYVQVEFVRSGLTENEVHDLARSLCVGVAKTESLRLVGLMTLPPFEPDPEAARPWFQRLRTLRDALRADTGLTLAGLSMGMSNDFEVAVEEGATIVRVGTTLFGARPAIVND